jgi:hypothetical protein
MRSGTRECVGDLVSGPGSAASQGLLRALDRVEGAKFPDDDLVRPLIERTATNGAFRHGHIVGAPPNPVVSPWFRDCEIFG